MDMENLPALSVVALFLFTILALIKFQYQPERVFGALLLILYASNLVSTDQVLASFANKGLLTLILLMVCSIALEKTQLLRLVAAFVIKPNYQATWLRLYGVTALSSALLNNTAVVSTMLSPIRNNPHHVASKLLLPLSYAAILGGTLTLVGTSTNLIVNSMVMDLGLPSLGFFDFTLVGSLVVMGCGALLFFLSHHLPDRANSVATPVDYFIDAKVLPNSKLIGRSIEDNGLRNLESLFLVEIIRSNRLISPVSPQEVIEEGDRLLFSGDIKKLTLLNQFSGLALFAYQNGLPIDNLTEVVVRPESLLAGKTLKQTGFRALFDAAVVAIKRDGKALSGQLGGIVLHPGDYLVLAVGQDFQSRHNLTKNFYFISGVETEHYLKGAKAWFACGGFFAAIFLAAFELVPLFQGMLLLLGALLLTQCLRANEVVARLPRQIWLIIASALLLSHALVNTQALALLSDFLSQFEGRIHPLWALILIYLFTWLLTELVTNNAAAAMMFPIAYGLATSLGSNVHSFVLVVAFAASASFVSPYGYQTNLMVYSAGQYRLSDFIKIGLPMSLLYASIVIGAVSYFYGI